MLDLLALKFNVSCEDCCSKFFYSKCCKMNYSPISRDLSVQTVNYIDLVDIFFFVFFAGIRSDSSILLELNSGVFFRVESMSKFMNSEIDISIV